MAAKLTGRCVQPLRHKKVLLSAADDVSENLNACYICFPILFFPFYAATKNLAVLAMCTCAH